MGSLCELSNYDEPWQKSPTYDDCPLESFKESVSSGEEESKFCSIGVILSRSCPDLPIMENMRASSAPKTDGHVYKRRKLQENSVAFLSEENATQSTRSSGYCSSVGCLDHSTTVINEDQHGVPVIFEGSNDARDNGNPSISAWDHLHNSSNIVNSEIIDDRILESVPNVEPNSRCIREEGVPVESSINNLCKLPSEDCSGINDGCLLTKSSIGNGSSVGCLDHSTTLINEDRHGAPAIIEGSNDARDNGNPSISAWDHLQSSNIVNSEIIDDRILESVPNVESNSRCIREGIRVESSINNICKSPSEDCSGINDGCLLTKSSIGNGSTLMKTEPSSIGMRSSDIAVIKRLGEFTSVKELCITVLKHHGLLGREWTSGTCSSLEALSVTDANCSQSCKICCRLDSPLKMLICDLCEEAFHVSCCNSRVKKLPVNEWYCQFCFRKKPKHVLKNSTGKSSNTCYGGLDPISLMLRNNQQYTTGVRIGKVFQAEVPEWSGLVYEDHNIFGEPEELDLTVCSNMNGWNCDNPPITSSIGNWVQCREMIYKDANDNEGTVCGKWRRSPLFVVQTDDWDCSCAMLWDPVHADCAVPQALETEIVLKHLKYIEMLRPRLQNKQQKTNQTRSSDP